MKNITLYLVVITTIILFFGIANNAKAGLISINNNITVGTLNLSESFTSFYSYGTPYSASANTGYEQEDSAIMFLGEYDNEMALFTLLDAPAVGRRPARFTDMTLSNFDIANVLLVDDPSESHSAGFSWRWVKCCSDGMIYKIDDKENFNIDIAFSNVNGLKHFTFLSFSNDLRPATAINVGTNFSIQSVSTYIGATAASVPEPQTSIIFIFALTLLTFTVLRKKYYP